MSKRLIGLVAVALAPALTPLAAPPGHCETRTIPGGLYFGQAPPGDTPVVFAPGIISMPHRYEYCLVFSPRLDECVFGVTNASWGGFNLFHTRMAADSSWSDPVAAPFQGTGDGTYASFSPDGNTIYFVSSRPSYPPTRIWRSTRAGSGWSSPVALDAPIYSGSDEWGMSLTDDGTLYFTSNRAGGYGAGDIYRAITMPGGEVVVENLGPTVNSAQNEGSPCVARHGGYLIYESSRPGGYGQIDLYITFNQGGTWTAPRNLGPTINTTKIEDGAFITPDGKYLFFNRRRAAFTSEQSEIWWVNARTVLGETARVEDPGDTMGDTTLLRTAPNPFRSSTTITYSVPSSGFVSVKVLAVTGRHVATLVNAQRAAGTYSVPFMAPRESVPVAGVYYCSLAFGGKEVETRKIIVR